MLTLLLVAAAGSDLLEDLIRKSAELSSFTAVYSLSLPAQESAKEVRIDYAAPSKVRVDFGAGAERTSMWCVDGVLVLWSAAVGGRVDSRDVLQELEPLERVLAESFPNAKPRPATAAGLAFTWSFDEETQKASFSIEAQLREATAPPLGWLQTLESKSAVPREDGGLLRFETDGHFRLALSKSTGMLQDFVGTSPKGELHLALVSVQEGAAIDPSRFEIAERPPEAKDFSDKLERSIRRLAQSSLRRRIYDAISASAGEAEWGAPELARIAAVWRAFHARVLPELLATRIEKDRTILKGVTERLELLRQSGKSAAEVEEVRLRERGYLVQRLDALESELDARALVPRECSALARAAKVQEQERAVLRELFRTLAREPALSAFDAAKAP